MENFAIVLSRLDGGSGLLDRFIITAPDAKIPLPVDQETSKHTLNDMRIQTMAEYYSYLLEIDSAILFYLDPEAQE